MKRRTVDMGLEGGMDVFANLCCLLIVTTAVVTGLARDYELPPVVLAEANASQLGESKNAEVTVTVGLDADQGLVVFLEDQKLVDGSATLERRLRETSASVLVIRADKAVQWEHVATIMNIATSLRLEVSAAVQP